MAMIINDWNIFNIDSNELKESSESERTVAIRHCGDFTATVVFDFKTFKFKSKLHDCSDLLIDECDFDYFSFALKYAEELLISKEGDL